MPKFKQADVDYLVKARKFIYRTIEDNSDWARKHPLTEAPNELRIRYEIRRKDNPHEDIRLQFYARKEMESPLAKWGTSLLWHGERIRGIDHKLREDRIYGGLIVGFIRHWHEHIWTDEDRDRNIIDVNSVIKNEDKRSIIELCMDRWNIEGYGVQYRLEPKK